jgi:hypothetical protein
LSFRIFLSLGIAVLLASSSSPATLQVELAAKTLVQSRLNVGVVGQRDRQRKIHELFTDAGCTADEQRLNKRSANVICTLPGTSSGAIVAGGHFDFAEHGDGIVDDWSGASLLPSLYQALKNKPRRHTYIFVAFAEEEVGLHGSSRYVKELSDAQKSGIRAFVNLECLGVGETKVWVHRSTPALLNHLAAVANAIHASLQGVDVDKVGDDDTHPFTSAHIPVISIHSITQATLPILHSIRDKLDAINLDEYYDSYKLIAFYLADLDAVTD